MTPRLRSRKPLHNCKVFELVEDTVELGEKHFTRFSVLHPGAAVILPIDAEGKLHLVRQYRHSVGCSLLEFPAGTLEKDEEPIVCAKREIQEEIGYSAAQWKPLGELLPAPGFCSERQFLFAAQELSPSPDAEQDEDEFIETEILSVPEVEDAIRSGELVDGKSIALFCRARLMAVL